MATVTPNNFISIGRIGRGSSPNYGELVFTKTGPLEKADVLIKLGEGTLRHLGIYDRLVAGQKVRLTSTMDDQENLFAIREWKPGERPRGRTIRIPLRTGQYLAVTYTTVSFTLESPETVKLFVGEEKHRRIKPQLRAENKDEPAMLVFPFVEHQPTDQPDPRTEEIDEPAMLAIPSTENQSTPIENSDEPAMLAFPCAENQSIHQTEPPNENRDEPAMLVFPYAEHQPTDDANPRSENNDESATLVFPFAEHQPTDEANSRAGGQSS